MVRRNAARTGTSAVAKVGDLPRIGNVRMSPKDIVAQGGDARFYHELAQRAQEDDGRRISLSVLLEELDPSSQERYPDERLRNLGAYGRAIMAAGIRLKTDPVMGYHADAIQEFYKSSERRALLPEFLRRVYAKARSGSRASTSRLPAFASKRLVTSEDEALGSSLRPYVEAAQVRNQQLAADISVADITAIDAQVDGSTYRTVYIAEATAANIRFVRVAEHAEIPMAMVSTSEHEISLLKYARGIEISDEARRRGRIDKLALFLSQVAVQQEADKVAQAVHTLINGDGNAGTSATEYNLTTLDSTATAGTLNLRAWLKFKMLFNRGFVLDTILGREADILQLLLLSTGTANMPIAMAFGDAFGGLTPINRRLADGVRFAVTDEAPSGKLVGMDSNLALERATETGSNVEETTRFVTRQVDALVMSEVEGYGIIDQRATKLLDIAQ